jgi:hypothetical protein
MDNSKAEENARLAFFCQWICANKRRKIKTLLYVLMAQDSTSLSQMNTVFPAQKSCGSTIFCCL